MLPRIGNGKRTVRRYLARMVTVGGGFHKKNGPKAVEYIKN